MPAVKPEDGTSLRDERAENPNQFQTTLWTTVLAAGQHPSPDSEAALARLCQIYWGPVFAYVRRRSPSTEQAQDLTQSFFARLLEKNVLARVERDRGRFRSFLLASVENYLCDEYDRATSLKRGGAQAPLSLEAALADGTQYPSDSLTPARIFEKQWARSLLDQVMARLAGEYQSGDRSILFEHLQSQLWGETPSIPYERLSQELKMSHVHLRVTVHRMRQRYREILREEIAQTVSSPDDIESEIRFLIQVVGS